MQSKSSVPAPGSILDAKLRRAFGPYVVRKDLVHSQEISRLPRFISEYLIAKFCSSEDDPASDDLKKLADFVNVHFPELRDKDKILHDIMTLGSYALMDEFKVETDIKGGKHRLIIPCLNVRDAKILSTILDENADLLRSGMWGIATLKYVPEIEEAGFGSGLSVTNVIQPKRRSSEDSTPMLMTKFTPFEVSNVALSEFASKRKSFTREEWIEVLVKSIGLNPGSYDARQRLLLLSRLVPLVESNCNILELGPKATGKTYLFRNISYSTRLISGGKVSPAVLFYNISTKTVGEIGVRDCVALDEIGKLIFSNSEEMLGKLKDYMVDGFFERGPKKGHAKASLVFMGNLEFRKELPGPTDIIAALPSFMKDSALLDRIHSFIPGWELPKIMQSSEHLASGYGIVADYLSEIFHQMSLDSYYSNIVSERLRIEEEAGGGVTIRDEKAIKKVSTGLLKLISPDKRCSDSDISLCVDIAIQGRERINSLLHQISPSEFREKHFAYSIRPE
jgi:ATP-dependent Lon protease